MKRVQEIREDIQEKVLEDEYEFMTVEDMREENFSETLGNKMRFRMHVAKAEDQGCGQVL